MIVNRKPLTFWEKLYLPAIIGGFKVTLKHAYATLIDRKVVTMEYPEQKWAVPADYRGAPYLVEGSGRQHQVRELPAVRVRLSAESHPHHAARTDRQTGRPHERREDAGGI